LEHEIADVRRAVAEDEWQSDSQAHVRPMLGRVWQDVVINDLDRSSALPHIFESCPDIALKWVRKRLDEDRSYIFFQLEDEKEIEAAIQTLSRQQRISLLSSLRDTHNHLGWARGIVGQDAEVYRAMLSIEKLARLHLSPLMGRDDNEAWVPMALLARDAGYSTEEVAQARFPISYSWTGSLSSMWNGWVSRFQSLESHANEEVRRIGKVGRRIAEKKARVAKEREHREAVYGMR
jgi:hypothetical protein